MGKVALEECILGPKRILGSTLDFEVLGLSGGEGFPLMGLHFWGDDYTLTCPPL